MTPVSKDMTPVAKDGPFGSPWLPFHNYWGMQ